MYTVDESMGSVSVCVNLTQPLIDILDETVNVFVMDNPSSIYIPADAPLASELEYIVNIAFFPRMLSFSLLHHQVVRALCLDKGVKGSNSTPGQQFLLRTEELSGEQMCCLPFLCFFLPLFRIYNYSVICNLFPAPDPPDFLSRYAMIEGSDYAQQTSAVNAIDDTLITELMRIVCYSQPIYDDLRLELDEFAGLSLGVKDNELTTVLTTVQPLYDQASILIVDNDSEFIGGAAPYYIVCN